MNRTNTETHVRRSRLIFCVVLGLGVALLLIWATQPAQASVPPPVPARPQESGTPGALRTSMTHTLYLPFIAFEGQTPPFGIQFYGSLEPSQGLTRAAKAGAIWIRMPVNWASIEPTDTTPEYYNWSLFDQAVTNATLVHIGLVVTISGQPPWAAEYPMGPLYDTADFLEFAGALVERYDGDGIDDAPGSPQIRYFELHNEPDNTDIHTAALGWAGIWGHNGAGYAALLEELYPAIKAASPKAQLVMGGLALDWFEEQGGPFDRYFLDDVLEACQGKTCFDMANFHYYPVFYSTWKPYGIGIIGKATYVRQRLAAFGMAGTPVICTETSWVSGSFWGSDELQSRYAVKGFARGLAADLPIVMWYKADDRGDDSLPGLLDTNLEPKPSYYAFQTTAAILHGVTYQRPIGLAETGSTQIEGYVFDAGHQRIDVVWTTDDTPFDADDDPWLSFSANTSILRAIDKFGNGVWLYDATDGVVDGKVTLMIGGSPTFLEYYP